MRVVVDNSKGAEAQFAANLEEALRRSGFDVELRGPSERALYDTFVHFVVEGVGVRVMEDAGRRELEAIAATVREVEALRPSARRRFRAVPIYKGETSRVLAWVDPFG